MDDMTSAVGRNKRITSEIATRAFSHKLMMSIRPVNGYHLLNLILIWCIYSIIINKSLTKAK